MRFIRRTNIHTARVWRPGKTPLALGPWIGTRSCCDHSIYRSRFLACLLQAAVPDKPQGIDGAIESEPTQSGNRPAVHM